MATSSPHVIHCAPSVFTENLNRLPHEITHDLAGDPLFELPRIIDLAERVATRSNPHLSSGDVYFNEGLIEAGHKPKNPDKPKVAAVDLVRQIETAQAWIILKHIEREPGYREILERCIGDILELSGKDLLRKIKWFEAILFVASPNRVTEYHVDREVSWILQIHGDKDIHLFNRADKDVVPDEELERYWTEDHTAAVYKPNYESRAMVFGMRPGTGVHIPINTPHWLQNKNNISVTLNVNFQFHDHCWANLYKANYFLRRAGITPTPPGTHPMGDRLKSLAFSAMQTAKQTMTGKRRTPTEALEQKKRIAQIVTQR